MKRKRVGLTEKDAADWASFARHVQPLRGRKRAKEPGEVPVAETKKPPIAPTVRTAAPLQPPVKARSILSPVSIDHRPTGIDSGSWRRLVDGRSHVQAKLDLHGMTADQACDRFIHFLQQSHATGLRCVEVVTGLGQGVGGVIRRELAGWLNRPDCLPLVLAVAHAHARNHGAVRIVLRRARG